MLKYLLLASIFIVFMAFKAQTFEQNTIKRHYDVQSLTLHDGLLQSSINDIIQDQKGLIWLGSKKGIQTFDGLQLNTIASGIWVNRLLLSTQGTLYIATEHQGLLVYDPQQRKLQQLTATGLNTQFIDTNQFNHLCQSEDGSIWGSGSVGLVKISAQTDGWQTLIENQQQYFGQMICSAEAVIVQRDSQLIKWHKNSTEIQILPLTTNHQDYSRWALTSINNQVKLLGKADGLYRISNDFNQVFKIWPAINDNLNATTNSTVEQLNSNKEQLNPKKERLITGQVNDILYQDERTVWVATVDQGLLLVDLANGETHQQLTHFAGNRHSLSGKQITRIVKDRTGLIWASIQGVGVDRFAIRSTGVKNLFVHSPKTALSNNITSISTQTNQEFWLADDHTRVYQMFTQQQTSVDHSQSIAQFFYSKTNNQQPLQISDITLDKFNQLWIATRHGIAKLNPQTIQGHFYPIQTSKNPGLWRSAVKLFQDKSGNIFATTVNGLLKFDAIQDRFIQLPISDAHQEQPHRTLIQVKQHPNGIIYALGQDNIYQVNDNNTLSAILDNSDSLEMLKYKKYAFTIDDQGQFLVAAQGAILEINSDSRHRHQIIIHSDSQLPDSSFYSLELDTSQNAWLSTNNGIVHFDRHHQQFIQYGSSDGILVREFNHQTSLQLNTGEIIFGGLNGWVAIEPKNMTFQHQAPQIILSTYTIGKHTTEFLPSQPNIQIPYGETIHLSFSAIDFHHPKDNRYSYFLEGYDRTWRDMNNHSNLQLTQIPPGNYTLNARAATKRSQWHPTPLKIPISVVAPFYKRSTAYILYALLIFFLIWSLRRYRQQLSAERQQSMALIKTSEERMQLALWGSGDSIWDWNLTDNQVFRTSLLFLGYEQNNVGNTIQAFKELIHPDDLPILEHELGEVLKGHTNEYSAQYRLKSMNDEWHWVADQGKVIETTASKKPLRLSGTIRDISVIKRHEQKLQQLNQELQKQIDLSQEQCASQSEQLTDTIDTLKNTQDQLLESEKKASLSNLVAGISHEINTPVGVALTAASHNTLAIEHLQNLFLQRKLTVKEMEKGLRQLKSSNERIESSINRTAQLIHTFKQVAVDHTQNEWRIIELPFYLIEIVPTFNSQIGGLNFKLEVVDGPFFDVESSPGDLYQIISQLVHNSVTHGFKGRDQGKITIETELKDQQWQLRYADNGNGINQETKNQIFEPFFSTRRDDGFSGLGMHLVSNIVNHSLGGTINCRSELGKGIKFTISLPLRRPNSPNLDMLQEFMI